ncbi:MAG: tRNA (guanine-N7-)-methyltransferase [Rickettsiales bacterium]|jgi:tRNA (guanine-N7-)-methyltransferase
MKNFTPTKFVRSFGRVRTRKLSIHKKSLFADLLPKYKIEDDIVAELKNYTQKIYLEIGFGFGDFIFENAKNNPEILYIGCEPHINGVVNLLNKLEQEPLENIKIYVGDSRIFLDLSSHKTFDKIYILNPDPWPKTKHYKRRLINVEFFELLHKRIKTNQILVIATDSDSYKRWVMAEYLQSGLWNWSANSKDDWQEFPNDWVKTKYQKKAEIEGRKNVYLEFSSINNSRTL